MRAIHIILTILFSAISYAQDFSFKVAKEGQGDPIIFIPGLASAGEVWSGITENFSPSYECHTLTLPGFAGQNPIDSDNYLVDIKNEIIQYMVDTNREGYTLIGHSLGGFLSLLIALDSPNLISKIIVVDGLAYMGAAQNPEANTESMRSTAENIRTSIVNQSPEEYKTSQKNIIAGMITDQIDIEVALQWGEMSDPNTIGQVMYELYQTDLRDELDEIKCPTLVLGSWAGYKDYGVTKEMVTKSFEAQFDKLKNKTIRISENGRHFLMWDDEPFIIEQLSSFLQD